MGKGLIWLLLALPFAAGAQDARTYLPAGAQLYAPLLAAQQQATWPQMPEPWTLAGQVEQESCVSLRNSRCWNPRAELKTSREYGFGFGQVTVAYRPDGSVRFNKFQELVADHATLRDWSWEDRYNPKYQLEAIVVMDLGLWRRIPPAATVQDHLSFMLSSYNGGTASLFQDQVLCSHTPGCLPGRWFGHVERTSLKSKLPQPAYGGQSWFSINRGYVRSIMTIRRDKYRIFWSP